MGIKFRDLRADEVECRIGQVSKQGKGLTLMLYKDARCDMNILDETVGAESWQREHYECKGNMYCKVGVWCDAQWVWKSDCGTESNTEAEKGEASDSFKRACVNWGIGRELYTAPFIWIPADKCRIDGGKCYDKFTVQEIVIENKVIVGLAILNGDNPVYTFGKCTGSHRMPQNSVTPMAQTNTAPVQKNAPATPRELLIAVLKERGVDAGQFALARGLNKSTSPETYIAILTELGVEWNG
jgi:hypothetical protein